MFSFSVSSKIHNYQVVEKQSLFNLIDEFISSETKYFIFYDEKINEEYVKRILSISTNSVSLSLKGGEETKSFENYNKIIDFLLENKCDKSCKLIVIGGGTLTDLIGYVAATYKRGLNYISMPSTTLCMIDASIGGKTAINRNGIKNCVGAVYPPELVLIGLDILETLDKRNFKNGLFEAVKMGIICDKNLFNYFIENSWENNLENIIKLSLLAKKKIVEADEFDNNIRKILNFGHTIGHAIELSCNLLHGEAIANGMLIVSKEASYKEQLIKILSNLNLEIVNCDQIEKCKNLITNDKKISNGFIEVVFCNELEKPFIKKLSINQFLEEI